LDWIDLNSSVQLFRVRPAISFFQTKSINVSFHEEKLMTCLPCLLLVLLNLIPSHVAMSCYPSITEELESKQEVRTDRCGGSLSVTDTCITNCFLPDSATFYD